MRRAFFRTIPSIFLVTSCGPANPEPIAAPPAPKPVASSVPPKPERTQARWLFPDTGGRADAQLDLGAKGILQVGERGRRWLVAPNGDVAQASYLVPQPLVDVQERSGSLFLVGRDGTTYEVKEPLGPVVATHPPPSLGANADVEAVAHTAAKDALLGLLRDGTLRRSVDGGANWSATKLALHPGEEAVGLAANKRGEVLVLVQPQRALLSVDDGATFTQIATPGFGAESVERDGHDDLWLHGDWNDRWARLAMGPARLQPVKEQPEPLASHVGKVKPTPEETVHRVLAGTRVVTLLETGDPKGAKKSVAVAVAPLGQPAGAPFEIEPAVSRWAPVRVAGHEGTVVVATYDQNADPPVTRVKRTTDEGKTWELVGALEGRESGSFHLAVGPNWVVVGELCNPKTKECTPPQTKIGNKAWAPLDVAGKIRPDSFVFDAARDRVVMIGMRGEERVLLESKLAGGPFAIVDVELPKATFMTSGFDSKGDLRLLSSTYLTKVTLGKTPSITKPLFMPFHTYEISLAGDRGYARLGDKAWETLDGGEHWAEVAPGPGGAVRCTPVGCVEAGAVRLGWDLNAGDPTPLAASLEEPKNTPKPGKTPAKPASAPPKISLTCTQSGAWKSMSGQPLRPGDAAYEGDVRFVAPVFAGLADGDTIFVARGATPPQKLALLSAAPKETSDKAVRSWTNTSSSGVVAARYSFKYGKTESGGYNPVDVELGWFSAARGKTGKVKLPKVPAFRVGRASPSALTEIVDGGMLFLPHSGDAPLYFVTDAGKVTQMPRPPQMHDGYGAYDHGVKIGDRIVLASTSGGVHIVLASTNDSGKTWTTTTWTVGRSSALVAFAGKPAVFVREGWGTVEPHALIPFDALTPDPPVLTVIDPKKLDVATAALTACTPKSKGIVADVLPGEDTAQIDLKIVGKTDDDTLDLEVSSRALRIGEGGDTCVSSLIAGSNGDNAAVINPGDLAHGWLVRAKDEGSEYRAIACKQ